MVTAFLYISHETLMCIDNLNVSNPVLEVYTIYGCTMHTRSLIPKAKTTVIGLGARLVHT